MRRVKPSARWSSLDGVSRRRGLLCLALPLLIQGSTAILCCAMTEPSLSYTNPVLPSGADPYCMRASDGKYYMVTTGLSFYSSDNLVDWKRHGRLKIKDVIGRSGLWAPEFVEYRGHFYLFYCARQTESDPHYLGIAVAERPEGPYQSKPDPLTEIHPSIDPHVFFDDDGKIYLYWSEKGIGVDHRAINVCELSENLMSLKGRPRMLIYSTQDWEYARQWPKKGWNEGPFLLKKDDIYYLMYSANLYATPFYGLGFATSRSPLGTFTKWKDNPVLSREGIERLVSGPGHHSVVASPDGRELFAVYHKHIETGEEKRHVCIDRMGFRKDGSIYVNGPTLTPQPPPSGSDGLYNVAPDAQIRTSSGNLQTKSYLIDGEIGILARFGEYEWKPLFSDQESIVRLEWDKPVIVSDIYLYDSAVPARKIAKASVKLSDGTLFEGVEFPDGPGAAANLSFKSRAISWIAVRIDEAAGKEPAALSEIMVRGRQF